MKIQTFKPSDTYEQALERAARFWGIEPEYGDTWGKVHVTTPEITRAILDALGVPTHDTASLDAALEDRLWCEWSRPLPPVAVIGLSELAKGFPIHAPAALARATVRLTFHWEGGRTVHRDVPLAALEQSGGADLRGAAFVRRWVPLPSGSPLGYHDVEIALDGKRASMRLIICPDRAYEPEAVADGRRTAGLAIALYGLRSDRNWGCGDLTDLEGLIDWVADDLGVSFIGLNPLHAIPNRQPFNISPYLPSSTFYKNLMYLDLDRVPDYRESRRAQHVFSSPKVQAEIAALRAAEFVEYERVCKLKVRALRLAFLEFLHARRTDPQRGRDFDAFVEREGELLDRYATWCALDAWLHRRDPGLWAWPDWPREFQDPTSPEVARFRDRHWRLVAFHKYVQWQLDIQLAAAQAHARAKGLSIGLYHDLALATDRCGADLWAYRPFYVAGCRVGAPPDSFSPKGQDWSFPPPNVDRHREDGYRLFSESIRKYCRHGGALRIDHVMRFFRLYWIPEGFDPAHGAYVRDNADDLLHIVALESVRQKVAVVGEDLGTVTDEIRKALDRFGLFGYRVLYFEKTDDGILRRPREYTVQALVSASTHDLPTLAGFWQGRDIEARRAAGLMNDGHGVREAYAERQHDKQELLDALFAEGLLPEWHARRAEHVPELTGELHNAIVGWLAKAPSKLMALSHEDLTKDTDQQNLPATNSEQYPNWRHKMRFPIEALRNHAAVDFTNMLRNWLRQTGRA